MKLELELDNGTRYMLKIPTELINKNTISYVKEALERWLSDFDIKEMK